MSFDGSVTISSFNNTCREYEKSGDDDDEAFEECRPRLRFSFFFLFSCCCGCCRFLIESMVVVVVDESLLLLLLTTRSLSVKDDDNDDDNVRPGGGGSCRRHDHRNRNVLEAIRLCKDSYSCGDKRSFQVLEVLTHCFQMDMA